MMTLLCRGISAVRGFWLVFLVLCQACPIQGQVRPATQPSDGFFGLDRVWDVHLIISVDQWEAMQPRGVAATPTPPGQRPPGAPGRLEFPWVAATLEWQSHRLEGVSVRFKGNSSFRASARDLKRPLKLDFNRFNTGQHFLGLTQLNLSNNAMDPSQAREALAYELFRSAGVPAARTAYLKVHLTVPGQMTRRYVGLYTAVEDVGKPFLKSWFGSAEGLLLKPEGFRGVPFLGDSWDAYAGRAGAKGKPQAADTQRFIALARLVSQADDATFRQQISEYLDVDRFLRFLAVNGACANMDSLFAMGHNYYLYLDPRTRRFVYIPWDLNEAFGAFMMTGGPDVQGDLSIRHPHAGSNPLIERILAVPEYDRAYRGHLAALIAGPMSVRAIDENLRRIEAACREAMAREKAAGVGQWPPRFGPGPGGIDKPDIREMVARRVASINAQLAGTTEGRIPESRRGPTGGARPPRDNPPRDKRPWEPNRPAP